MGKLNPFSSDFSFSPGFYSGESRPVSVKNTAHFKMLLEAVQSLSLAKDLETIMYIVRKAARKLTGADGATFVLRETDQCYYADEDAISPLWKGKRFPMKVCISGWVMENKQAVVIEDIYADARIPMDAYRPTFVKSLAMVPIRTNSPIGAIGTYWADIYHPTEEQINFLQALADSTSVAMENIKLLIKLENDNKESSVQVKITQELKEANLNLKNTLNELNRRNEEMQWLKELSSRLQTSLYVEEAYALISQYTSKLLPDLAGIFYIMHPSRNYLESAISWNDPVFEEKIIKPEECFALRRGCSYQVVDPEKELTCAHYNKTLNNKAYSCIPLFAQSDILGLLYVEWKNNAVNTQVSVEKEKNQAILISMLAEQIALGISNIKMRETLRNQSLRDSLTGLYNRRYLDESLERELSRCQRKSASLAVLMLDVDHFKRFNDEFGHEAGDIVIQSLANVLRKFSRKDDIACRYGGEEFIFVIPEIDLEAVLKRAESLHEALSQLHIRYGGKTLTQITISVGVALYPLHGNNMHDLIAASDRALYEAKNTGRNKTVVYSFKHN
jgi:diguanylate cyclase (GGDEF)-like protein